ncbi:hypothetical protein [Methylovirgula sp. HY1]|uniref:hypothetical protein n=1 Tax=Methylovirgula sp. HY1 TaxID=2822761 RepID=UPI001C5A658E|nr:hypothetical protein [Methylovirgula sp. HY1]QXX74236.1 hypothetical protein MHY1_01046 [Methylovirgula sp. HY1]
MRPDPISVTLGDTEYKIKPLTVKQHQDISLVLAKAKENVYATWVEWHLLIITIVLRRDHAEAVADDAEMELGDIAELRVAVHQILNFGGYLKGSPEGEALAAETTV